MIFQHLQSEYPYWSPYSYVGNSPIYLLDVDGLGTGDMVRKGEGPAAYAKKNHITLDKLARSNPEVFKNYKNCKNKSEYWKNADKNWVIQPGQALELSETTNSNNSAQSNNIGNNNQSNNNQNDYYSPVWFGRNGQPTINSQTKDPKKESEGNKHWVGPTLILLGQPFKALKPVGVFGSAPGSSIASYTLSKTFPQTFTKTLGKTTGTQVVKVAGTNVIGRAAGRMVPVVGCLWLIYDIGSAHLRKFKDDSGYGKLVVEV